MSRPPSDEVIDELFVGCAFLAFVEEARACGGWPDPVAARRRAYEMYEAEKRALDP